MPTPTYTPLANITLGASATTVTFGSIPATYRDLVIVALAGGTDTGTLGRIRLNGDTGTNYSFQRMSGNGSNASAASGSSETIGRVSQIATTETANLQMSIQIMDYSATDKHKTIICRADNASKGTEAIANRWANTAAVTTVAIVTSVGSWTAGSTFALYGIVA